MIITLYDLDGGSRPFSTFVWRTHLILGYKRLPYRTIFVPFPDIESTAISLGAPPTSAAAPRYTVPILVDESPGSERVVVSGTAQVAQYLDRAYPEPRLLRYGAEDEERWEGLVGKHLLWKVAPPNVVSTARFLEGRVLEYYVRTRPLLFGKPLEEVYDDTKYDEVWAGIEQGLDELSAFIDTLPPSKRWLFGTDTPAYADFVLCACFCWTKAISYPGTWDHIRSRNEGKWQRLYDSCVRYMPKNLS